MMIISSHELQLSLQFQFDAMRYGVAEKVNQANKKKMQKKKKRRRKNTSQEMYTRNKKQLNSYMLLIFMSLL